MIQSLHLALLALGTLACGMAGQWLLFTVIGAGEETDAYFAALVVPQVFLAIVGGALLHALVPLLAQYEAPDRRRLVWALLLRGIGPTLAAVSFLALTAPLWMRLIAPGFSGSQWDQSIAQARIQALALGVSLIALLLAAGAQAAGRSRRVERASFAGALLNLAIIAWLVSSLGALSAAWANVGRAVLQCLLIVPLFGLPVFGDQRGDILPTLWGRMRPLLVGTSLPKADPLIDRNLMSLTADGTLSLFQLAQVLISSVIEIINRAWVAPALPVLARCAEAPVEYAQRVRGLMLTISLITVAVVFPLVVVGHGLLQWVLEHGRFSGDDVTRLWWIMVGLAGVLIGGGLGQAGSAAFYARGDTLTPARLALTSFCVFAPLKVGAFFILGLPGLVVACSAYYLTNALILTVMLRRLPGWPKP
ncbi:MAG: hypothetical protein KA603_14270 [Azonexus sp.]|nr:hypothetical protein [Betaproteobacteria bacterium]MBK8917018.1 hypothetical protein [Betaproteobacteria bacterium]MBP6037289.1 hypothetical protein [Azonexus sp.]MBP6907851.1 hypothetical protein [Azonexus sp.]